VVGSLRLTKTLAAHWNGTEWSIVDTPSPMDGPNPATTSPGVTAISGSNIDASGFEGNVNNQNFDKSYVLRFNGTTWSLVTLPNAGAEGSRLNAITSLSASDVWAVGATLESDGTELTLAEQFNGTTTWAIIPPRPGQTGHLAANGLQAAASPVHASMWALGGQQTSGEYCQQSLALQTTHG
jgi:hypothetical protein